MKRIEKSIELAGRKLTLTTGHIAEQASGAVIAQHGDTVVMATIVAAPLQREVDYFPLGVEYQEKLFAGGKIKGSRWVKRDGRPSDEEVLTSRLIDRSIRPLFPKVYKKEVQLIVTVLSVDNENSPQILAGIAASAAISISPIPWKGPVGIVKVGMIDGKLVANPTNADLLKSDLELVVSGTKDAIVMIEAGSKEVTEDQMREAIEFAHEESKALIAFLSEFEKEVGTEKEVIEAEKTNKDVEKKVKDLKGKDMKELIQRLALKEGLFEELNAQMNEVAGNFEDEEEKVLAKKYFEDLFKKELRAMVLAGKRADGRKTDELRKITAEVGILPRTHGSALFQRGQTQVLSVATLGSPSMGQLLETSEGETEKLYMHHYSMPPFATGEAGRVGSPNRREIGHGALGERALMPVIPTQEAFPYAMQIVSEVLSSNGSTSMASACGSSLALMDAGVPIKAMVGGIAMGLIVESETEFAILTDIIGLEDFNGDMDFKVAGTRAGITALQLDVKTLTLTPSILEKALAQGKVARDQILDVMEKAIDKPRATVSQYAPKIKSTKIDPSKIGEIVGSGGKTIKKLMAQFSTQIDIDDDGTITVTGIDGATVDATIETIEGMVRELQPGEIFDGTVKRIQPFGVFVEVLPGKEGMVHVSDMSEEYVSDPGAIVQEGDSVQIRVKEVDKMGRLNLSMVLDPSFDERKEQSRGNRGGDRDGGGSSGGRGYDRPQRSYSGGDRGGSRSYGSDRGRSSFSRDAGGRGRSDSGSAPRSGSYNRRPTAERSSGPHFPASRLMGEDKKFGR